jgi:hypothetical protein
MHEPDRYEYWLHAKRFGWGRKLRRSPFSRFGTGREYRLSAAAQPFPGGSVQRLALMGRLVSEGNVPKGTQ